MNRLERIVTLKLEIAMLEEEKSKGWHLFGDLEKRIWTTHILFKDIELESLETIKDALEKEES